MSLPLEQYAMIGDLQTAALIGSDGSLDWLCLPRFDSPACFAALLGDERNGRWLIAPAEPVLAVRRRYRPGTLVLETEIETASGVVRLVDCMPPRDEVPDVIRLVQGVRGRVPMRMQLIIRLDYGAVVPWIHRLDGLLHAVAGPDALVLRSPVETHGEDLTTVANFAVAEGEELGFALAWYPSHESAPSIPEPAAAVAEATRWWQEWSARCRIGGRWREQVVHSLVVLKALTYLPTGGIIAAPTTSLPERLGGTRNWDYRYCWLRDATFTLDALLAGGYEAEAIAWRNWLLRAAGGDPPQLQILYGAAGERRQPEWEVSWLAGYEGSTPVRVGNAACTQFQLDVYGEVIATLHDARITGLREAVDDIWALERELLAHLTNVWREKDFGIWEVRGEPRHFTHSKLMAWVAFDRGVADAERFGLECPVDEWRAIREEIRAEILSRGFDADRGAFVQSYGSDRLDASLLLIPIVGFLPAGDGRVRGTIEAVRRELCDDDFVMRYSHEEDTRRLDGLPPGEGAFVPCTLWLAQALALAGEHAEAARIVDRVAGITGDAGLLAEAYEPEVGRMVGNYPQALSHVAFVNAATALNVKTRGRPSPATPAP